MKKMIILALLLAGCTSAERPEREVLRRPAEIPLTTCDGTPIEWTWKKQRAWKEGRFSLVYKGDCVIATVISKK